MRGWQIAGLGLSVLIVVGGGANQSASAEGPDGSSTSSDTITYAPERPNHAPRAMSNAMVEGIVNCAVSAVHARVAMHDTSRTEIVRLVQKSCIPPNDDKWLEFYNMKPRAVMPSSIGSSGRPTPRIWKK